MKEDNLILEEAIPRLGPLYTKKYTPNALKLYYSNYNLLSNIITGLELHKPSEFAYSYVVQCDYSNFDTTDYENIAELVSRDLTRIARSPFDCVVRPFDLPIYGTKGPSMRQSFIEIIIF